MRGEEGRGLEPQKISGTTTALLARELYQLRSTVLLLRYVCPMYSVLLHALQRTATVNSLGSSSAWSGAWELVRDPVCAFSPTDSMESILEGYAPLSLSLSRSLAITASHRL